MKKIISLKKVTSLCIVFCMFSVLMVPKYTQAEVNSNSISSDTIITEDNIYEVLDYLGLDSNDFVKADTEGTNNRTVGDVESAIEQAKNQPSKIETKLESQDGVSNSVNSITSTAASGTMMLYATVDVDSYIIEYEVAGKYSGGFWTGATSATADIDSDQLVIVYKITSKSLNLTNTATIITLNASLVVTSYIGVGDVGLVKIGTQTITSHETWDAIDYIGGIWT